MKTVGAIRQFINNGPRLNPEMVYHPATVSEIKEFKDSMSVEEWHELGRQACEIMGETFES